MIHRISGLVMPETGKECMGTDCNNCALEYGGIKFESIGYMFSHCILVEAVMA